MHILFIIESLGNGGAEQVLVNTLPALKESGITCEVAILFQNDNLAKELEYHDIKIHKLELSHKWNIFEAIYKINTLVRKGNFDIIHAHLFFAYFYTGLNKIFFPKIKTITTFHNQAYNTYPSNTIIKRFRKYVDAFIVNNLIDKKVAVSYMVKQHYEKNLSIPNVDVIFNSFPLEKIGKFKKVVNKTILKEFTNKSFDTYSITPGRLVKEKGHKYLIESLVSLKSDISSHCHFIVGAGPLYSDIKLLIENNNLTNVILIQGLKQDKLFCLINACDFVVTPSISEGFPMVVGECMALGKPIITTEISGVIDMIESRIDGILIPVANSSILSSSILEMIKNENLRKSLSKHALEKIKKFNTNNIVEEWLKYYEDMLKK